MGYPFRYMWTLDKPTASLLAAFYAVGKSTYYEDWNDEPTFIKQFMPEKWTLKLSQMSSEFVNTSRRTFFSHICFGQFSSIIYIYIFKYISFTSL